VKQRLAKPGVRDLVAKYAAAINNVEPFEPAPLEESLKRVVEEAGVKVGDLVHAVRVAVTGKTVGPGLYDCLAILGKERSLARLEKALPLCG
jgi:glutamyl-tRNA synthetase